MVVDYEIKEDTNINFEQQNIYFWQISANRAVIRAVIFNN